MSSDLRAAILAANDLDRRGIGIPEWGVTVHVQHMNGLGRALVEKAFADHKGDPTRLMARVVVIGIVDQDGRRVFTDGDEEQLLQKNFEVVKRLYEAIMEFNDASTEAMKSAEGNSGAPPSTSS